MDAFTIVGKGGREHALAAILAKSHTVYSFGGSDAIRELAAPLDEGLTVSLDKALSDDALTALLSQSDATIVLGPEQPMAAGWVDQIALRAPNARVLGPNQYTAQLESSKAWAKDFMIRHGVPTGDARRISSVKDFERCTLRFEPPYVIKADGLAAGKGVGLFDDVTAARAFVEEILSGDRFGHPQTALIEEYLDGPELSIFLLLDGWSAVQLGTARDYKRAYDGDEGPNTGGMGSFTPVPDISDADQAEIDRTVLRPIMDGLRKDGLFYKGFLYVGLMRTARGFKVLEFNVRMGDPETQAVLPSVAGHVPALLTQAAVGNLAALRESPWLEAVAADFSRVVSSRAAVCVVLASEAYPSDSPVGRPLEGLEQALERLPDGVHLFHAGTKRTAQGWCSYGGRVLNAVGTGESIAIARDRCYQYIEELNSAGLRFRRDIAD